MMRDPYADSAREFRDCLRGMRWWEAAIFGFVGTVMMIGALIARLFGWQPLDGE